VPLQAGKLAWQSANDTKQGNLRCLGHVLCVFDSKKIVSELGTVPIEVLCMEPVVGASIHISCMHASSFSLTILQLGPTIARKKRTNFLNRFLCQVLGTDALLCIEPVQEKEREG
jgi:hypothetical protein